MPDFRFEGTSVEGKAVRGTVVANSYNEARQKIRRLATQYDVKIGQIQKRKTYLYKAEKTGEPPATGEQKAYSKQELREALERLGYERIKIQPKLFDFNFKPPDSEIVTFVRLSADLMREQLPFNEIFQLLINDVQNNALREALKEINNDLRQGKDSEKAFLRQEKVLGRFTARMLGLGSKSGNMAVIYESTAKFLERNAEFKRNLRSALIMPLFTLLVLFGACLFYIAYIFPETAKLFSKMGTELPPMTRATMDFSDFLVNNALWLFTVFLIAVSGMIYYFQTPNGRLLLDRMIIRIPILGDLIHKTYIEIFCRVFSALYSGSGENVDAIKIAAEACGNRYMEERIKTVAIPMMLSEGRGLVQAFDATGVFTKTALARFMSGSETGTIKQTAAQIANYYEKETVYKLKNAVEFIQILISMIIMVVITALTLLSSEMTMVKPKSPFG